MTGSKPEHRHRSGTGFRRAPVIGRQGGSPSVTAPRQEVSRRAAQQALLVALRRVHPEPLVELRDGLLTAAATVQTTETKRPPVRSTARQTAIHRAQRRVQALTTIAEDPPVVVVDFDGWADRWHLHALRDLAPYLRRRWRSIPTSGARFLFPRILPIRPQVPIDFNPDRDSEDDIVAHVRALYAEHARALPMVPAHRRRQLAQHAEWYVHRYVQGWTLDRIATETTTAKGSTDVSTIRKGIAEFVRLLDGK